MPSINRHPAVFVCQRVQTSMRNGVSNAVQGMSCVNQINRHASRVAYLYVKDIIVLQRWHKISKVELSETRNTAGNSATFPNRKATPKTRRNQIGQILRRFVVNRTKSWIQFNWLSGIMPDRGINTFCPGVVKLFNIKGVLMTILSRWGTNKLRWMLCQRKLFWRFTENQMYGRINEYF